MSIEILDFQGLIIYIKARHGVINKLSLISVNEDHSARKPTRLTDREASHDPLTFEKEASH